MKIYFAGSIRGGRADAEIYAQIIALLSNYGTVLTEHVGSGNPMIDQHLTDQQIFARDTDWLMSADLVIAEVTTPSLGVGYELALAECHAKSILCLYRSSVPHRLSAMIAGNPRFRVISYTSVSDLVPVFESILPLLTTSSTMSNTL